MGSSEPIVIGSKNQRLQRLRRLVSRSKARSEERAFVADGPVLVADALASDLVVEEIFAGPEIWAAETELVALIDDDIHRYEVQDSILARLLDPQHPRPLAAVVSAPTSLLTDVSSDEPILVAVELRDPGNMGTVIRTAEAAGFGAVVVVGDSVDHLSPKVVRASAGSIFRMPVVALGTVTDAFAAIRDRGWPILAAVVDPEAEPYDRFDLTAAAIVVGNEPHGLSPEAVGLGDGRFTIPVSESVESLNVAAAASVLCFESTRQRRSATSGARKMAPKAEKSVGQHQVEPSGC